MSKIYTITLTDAEEKALSTVCVDNNEWIQNLVHERCRIAIDEIVQVEVQRKLAAGESINGSKEDIVLSAEVETAAEKEQKIIEQYKNLQEQQG